MSEKREELLANEIKEVFANYLQNNFNIDSMGYEVMYGTSRRVVDMLAIIKNRTYAIEIKSASDNIKRLEGQINEYQKIFDYTIVVCSKNHITEISSLLNKNIGIYLINKKIISLIRKPTLNKKTIKFEMLNTIPSILVKKKYNIKGYLNSDEIRVKASLRAKSNIHNFLVNYLIQKLSKGTSRT